jgi:outer membrane protein assembly factor BamB
MVSACNKNGWLYVFRSGRLADGPVWSFKLASSAKVGTHHCLAATVFDGSHLIASGVATSIAGTHYLGSVREFNASTGHIVWQRGLPAGVIGTPSLNGAGVLAVPTMDSSVGAANAVFLIDAADGTIITQLPTGSDGEFAQPIFADGHLFLATLDQGLTSYSAP